ncbi:MAG: DUF126 domain-containing protein [Chloroflexota bacterium]
MPKLFTDSGALLLENTCPEVVPYDRNWVRHILTNSMKAEHYIKSGLNGVPTSVMRLRDVIAIATGEVAVQTVPPAKEPAPATSASKKTKQVLPAPASAILSEATTAIGQGLPSQPTFRVIAEAFVTPAPITFLGYVNRKTGEIEEEGHPANGQSMQGKIAIFPAVPGPVLPLMFCLNFTTEVSLRLPLLIARSINKPPQPVRSKAFPMPMGSIRMS